MKEKLENFWYHYKWTTIVVAFFAVLLVVGIVQMVGREDYDTQILYAGPSVTLTQSGSEDAINRAFCQLLTSDRNEDGKINLLFRSYAILSDEQLAEKQAAAAAEGDHVYYDTSLRQNSLSEIGTLLATGEVSVCLLDPYVYGIYQQQEAFVPLEEVLGYTPDFALDDCSVYLKDTDFGSYYTAFAALPDDTILCIRKKAYETGITSSKKLVEAYEYNCELFRAIFAFQPPD